jgi:hypothetical protein
MIAGRPSTHSTAKAANSAMGDLTGLCDRAYNNPKGILGMKRIVGLAAGLMLALPAFASTIYSNPYNASADTGACDFSSTCAREVVPPIDDFAAQLFTIATDETITAGDFTELDSLGLLTGPTSVNWAFYSDVDGLPGTLLDSGTAAISSFSSTGIDASGNFWVDTYSFSIPAEVLTSGSYFFALQTTTSYYSNNLAEGTTDSGAAETKNGGTTWAAGYEGIGGVAVELDNTPEPATLGLVAVAFGVLGLMRRRSAR